MFTASDREALDLAEDAAVAELRLGRDDRVRDEMADGGLELK